MEAPTYNIFRCEPVDLRTISSVATDVSLQQLGFIQFGLLMLIATPILRVAFCAVAFAKQGDRLYLLMKGDRSSGFIV